MKINEFEIIGLNGREGTVSGNLDYKLNILTGRNGAGKTNVLKLLWYILSGNILLALKEVPFQKAMVDTDVYRCTVYRTGPQNCRIEFESGGGRFVFEDDDDGDEDHPFGESAEDKAKPQLLEIGKFRFFSDLSQD